MPTRLSTEVLDRTFELLEGIAAAGNRCPMSAREGREGLPVGSTLVLARAGRIKIEIFARNFRRVEILTGPHAGKKTAAPPAHYGPPYKIVGTETVTNTHASKVSPSAPRPLTANELEKR